METIGVRELQQHASAALRRVERGETIGVTDRGRLVAILAPPSSSMGAGALIASGQVAQIPYHLNRAMDNGLTQEQASEVLTHLAFYAGWPNVFSALPVVKGFFATRK